MIRQFAAPFLGLCSRSRMLPTLQAASLRSFRLAAATEFATPGLSRPRDCRWLSCHNVSTRSNTPSALNTRLQESRRLPSTSHSKLEIPADRRDNAAAFPDNPE